MARLEVLARGELFPLNQEVLELQLAAFDKVFEKETDCFVIVGNKKYNNLCSACPKYLLRTFFPETKCSLEECVEFCKTVLGDENGSS